MKISNILKPLFSARQAFTSLVPFLNVMATVVSVTASSSVASAKYVFAPALYYTTEENKTGGSTWNDENTVIADLRLGYIFDQNGLYVGGAYKYEDTTNQGRELNGYAFGPSVGYHKSGFSFIATYHFLAQRKITIGGMQTKYSSGSGYQFDIAYAPQISENFEFGPQFSYRRTKYDRTQENGAAETSTSQEVSSITPGVVLFFHF